MKRLQLLFVALLGAAAAIPGIASIKQFPLPGGTSSLFAFVLTVVSTAIVLTAYVVRERIGKLAPHILWIAPFGLIAVFATFIGHLWVTNLVLVEHNYSGLDSTQTTFFPLYLDFSKDSLVKALGGRRRFIETRPYSPSSVADMRTERNLALTMGTLLATYGAMIASVSALFALLGFCAIPNAEEQDVAGEEVQSRKPGDLEPAVGDSAIEKAS